MNIKSLTMLATASILSLGLIAGCAGTSSNDTASSGTASSDVSATAKAQVYIKGGAAIGGYDPVAYFEQGGPTAGSDEFTHEWRNATWKFSSAENRDLFAANPEQYAPQYGGFCAWAVSQGSTAPIDPNAWKIVDDKLYLNFNQDIQARWEKDIPGNIAKADSNWPGVLASN
ncbi:MAG: YHS domain-containing protein [Cyanothece sp. SIO1E1]|nr:YHS domain-containing protein [Cyanothece sp. SIO1E1]